MSEISINSESMPYQSGPQGMSIHGWPGFLILIGLAVTVVVVQAWLCWHMMMEEPSCTLWFTYLAHAALDSLFEHSLLCFCREVDPKDIAKVVTSVKR